MHRILKSSILVLLLLLSGLTHPCEAEEGWREQIRTADKLRKEKKFDRAADLYLSIIASVGSTSFIGREDRLELYYKYMTTLESAGWREASKTIQSALSDSNISSLAVRHNNTGVSYLGQDNFREAIKYLQKAVKVNPKYDLARKNLAIAHNNYGLALQKEPGKAIVHMRKALYLDPDNDTTRANVNGLHKVRGVDPKSFTKRVSIGNQLVKDGDRIGAIVEYREALTIKENPEVRKKLKTLEGSKSVSRDSKPASSKPDKPVSATRTKPGQFKAYLQQLERSIKAKWKSDAEVKKNKPVCLKLQVTSSGVVSNIKVSEPSGSKQVDDSAVQMIKQLKMPSLPKGTRSLELFVKLKPSLISQGRQFTWISKDVDFGPFMMELQKRIKKAWFPPKGKESKRVAVVFKVYRDGTTTKPKIVKSSGIVEADQQALKAISSKYHELPEGAPPSVDIKFTFDYNVFRSNNKGVVRKVGTVKKKRAPRKTSPPAADVSAFIARIVERISKENATRAARELIARSAATSSKDEALALVCQAVLSQPSKENEQLLKEKIKGFSKSSESTGDMIELSKRLWKVRKFKASACLLSRCVKKLDQGSESEESKVSRKQLHTAFAECAAAQIKEMSKANKQDISKYKLVPPGSGKPESGLQIPIASSNPFEEFDDMPPMPRAIEVPALHTATLKIQELKPESAPLDGIISETEENTLVASLEKLAKERSNVELRWRVSELLTKKGNKYSSSEDYERASSFFRDALYVYPENKTARKKLDSCLEKLGIKPGEAFSRFVLSKKLLELDRGRQALVEAAILDELDDDPLSAVYNGLSLLKDRQIPAGMQRIHRACKEEWPESREDLLCDLHVMLAGVYYKTSQWARDSEKKELFFSCLKNASIEYGAAVALRPEHKQARAGLLKVAKAGLRWYDTTRNKLFLGGAYILNDDGKRAVSLYSQALQKEPNNQEIRDCMSYYVKWSKKRSR